MSILAAAPAALPPFPVPRLTVEGYQRLIREGLLTEADRVELLEGFLVPKPVTRHPPHDNAIELITDLLAVLLPAGWRRRVQLAITTADSQPEPDFAVVRTSARQRQGRHPAASEVGLVIEVADSSLDSDREHKGRIYARASIPVYWIVNIIDRQVEVYTSPSGPADEPAYNARQDFTPGQDVPLVLDGVEVAHIPVADVLP
jgi:Uma2 family endonuclease